MSDPAPPEPGRPGRLVAWLVLLVSVPACLGGALLGLLFVSFAGTQARLPVAPGEIIRAEGRSGGAIAPVIVFTTPNGATHEITGNIATDSPSWRVGDRVGVRYSPDAPGDAVPDTFWSVWLLPVLLGGLALLLLVPGATAGLLALRRIAGASPRRVGAPAPGTPRPVATVDPVAAVGPIAGVGAVATVGPADVPLPATPPREPPEPRHPSPVPPTGRDTIRALMPAGVAGCGGLVAAAAFALTVGANLDHRSRSALAEGEVVAIVPYSSRGSSYAPVFRFRTADGTEVRVRQDWGSGTVPWTIGERTTMRYDPLAPSRAAPDRLFAQWGGAMLWAAGATLLLLIGAALARGTLRRARRWSRLGEEGRPVEAAILDVRDWLGRDGERLWCVRALWEEPGSDRRWLYESLPLAEDPAPLLAGRERVRVAVHPADPSVYAMLRPEA